MPESLVNVTEGSGKAFHTFQRVIGSNTVEDQSVINGEPYLAGYTIPVTTAVSTATANSHLLQIMAGSTLKVRIRRIRIHQMAMATAAAMMQVELIRLTTAGTGGTSLTPNPLDPGDAASGATAMTLPTAKGSEGTILGNASAYMMQTIGASAVLINPIADWEFDLLRTKPIVIAAGTTNGIAVKNITAIAAGTVFVEVWFDETNF